MTVNKDVDTVYWCKIFKGPEMNEKHHIIGFEPILTRDTISKRTMVQHMTLFECTGGAFTSDQLGQLSKSNGLVCNSNNLNTVSGETNWKSCITPVASWSNGGVAQYLPEHVGIPVGKMNYYMLEIHYDNPSRTNFEDKSGLRIHYTEKLRKFDGGILVTGVAISNTQFIPPRQKSFRNLGICGQTCTGRKDVFPEEGINLVSVSIQTHSAGRKFILSHVRNGTELDKIVEDK